MFASIKRRLRHVALASIVTGISVTSAGMFAATSHAGGFDCGSNIAPVHPLVTVPGLAMTPFSPDGFAAVQLFAPPQSSSTDRCTLPSTAGREMASTEELCGWVDMEEVLPPMTATAEDFASQQNSVFDFEEPNFVDAFDHSLAGAWVGGCSTHDSCPVDVHRILKQTIAARPSKKVVTEPSPQLTAVALATSIASLGGVKVHQFVEPFAMAGPAIENSLASVRELHAWCRGLVDSAESLRATDERNLDAQIQALAMQEPIDTNGHMALPVAPSIVIAKLDPLVGSAPLVMTIPVEEYLAYDLAPRDMMVWAMPALSSPFCIRQQLDRAAEDSMWQETLWQPTDELVQSSPECLMDDLLCRLDVAGRSIDIASLKNPSAIGRSIAGMVKSSSRVAGDAICTIAMRLPKTNAGPELPVVRRLAKENTCTMR